MEQFHILNLFCHSSNSLWKWQAEDPEKNLFICSKFVKRSHHYGGGKKFIHSLSLIKNCQTRWTSARTFHENHTTKSFCTGAFASEHVRSKNCDLSTQSSGHRGVQHSTDASSLVHLTLISTVPDVRGAGWINPRGRVYSGNVFTYLWCKESFRPDFLVNSSGKFAVED